MVPPVPVLAVVATVVGLVVGCPACVVVVLVAKVVVTGLALLRPNQLKSQLMLTGTLCPTPAPEKPTTFVPSP